MRGGLPGWPLALSAFALCLTGCVINAYQTDITTKPSLTTVVGHCYQFAQDAVAVTRPMHISLNGVSAGAGFVYDGWLLWPSPQTIQSEPGSSVQLKSGDRFVVERAISYHSFENTIDELYIRLGPEHGNLLLDGFDLFGTGSQVTQPERRLIGPCHDTGSDTDGKKGFEGA